ncbi:thiol:disulfide interchange protein DsbA [Pasteurella multocida]|uniref:thiol:disulfide interchange protein DsbA n=1 Tax=Pasteurella multocida TaxID=747 RepID=UPI00021446C1|nr:DsbA family protein [Pasteurella multocida]EGP03955.1 DsbA [Pasteurella multocida subsp. gallicida str. Anand1_poultry]MDY0631564.1 DsbA family protein [Pasteurella multocida]QDA12824.1 thiol:disulfide interchange protein [Pasteurella multocida subsp. multocida]QDA14846.1 thiol:disulfide interchange protein [Pasteurella multocida subsp. multocida]HAS02885.1 thiol:disulfide interchange protein [Pasteurella multocida]
MKKLVLAVTSFLFAVSVQATNLTEGKQYVTLNQAPVQQAEVIEFFSFYCPHCYSFEYEYQIPNKVKQQLPEGVSLKQYHVNFLGGEMGKNLTRAWALAMATGVQDKVKEPLFFAAQQNKLRSMDDIRQIFLANGLNAEQFDGGINSFAVTALTNKQVTAAEHMKVRGVPDFYVNGRYRVNPEGLKNDSHEAFVADYVETVKGLLQK